MSLTSDDLGQIRTIVQEETQDVINREVRTIVREEVESVVSAKLQPVEQKLENLSGEVEALSNDVKDIYGALQQHGIKVAG